MGTEKLALNMKQSNENGGIEAAAGIHNWRTAEVVSNWSTQERAAHSLMLAQAMEQEGISPETYQEIRNELVVFNMPLVTHIINKYGYFNPDKFQNGCVGLLKAASTFRTDKEVPFHNYAALCIETEIRLAYKRSNRMFESKNKGFLESLDAPTTLGNGDTVDKYDMAADEASQVLFDELIEEAEVDTLFYQIIIPCIEEYGTRSKDIDMEQWRDLEIQYFLELAAVASQRKRLTFTAMAAQLGTTPQNIRTRHKKVMEAIREACEDYGFRVGVHGGVFFDDGDKLTRVRNRNNRKNERQYWQERGIPTGL